MLLVAYGFSNIIGLLILWSSFRKPWITRLALALLFAWAAWTNYTVCRAHPNTYLGFSRYAFSYLGFINGWFSLHIIQMVTAIAIGQALIAIGLAYKGIWVTLACAGAIIFSGNYAFRIWFGISFSTFSSLCHVESNWHRQGQTFMDTT